MSTIILLKDSDEALINLGKVSVLYASYCYIKADIGNASLTLAKYKSEADAKAALLKLQSTLYSTSVTTDTNESGTCHYTYPVVVIAMPEENQATEEAQTNASKT